MGKSKDTWERYHRLLKTLCPGALHEQRQYFQALESRLKPGMRWLDAGCGHNLVPPWLSSSDQIESGLLNTAGFVVGCDIDTVSLQKGSPILRSQCDLASLCFANASFDLVTCNMVVEHLAEPDRVFAEFYRVLAPGGTLLILTPNMFHWTMLISKFTPHFFHVLIRKLVMGSDPEDVFPVYYRSNTLRKMQQRLSRAGFRQISVESWASVPHLVGTGPLLLVEAVIHRLTRGLPQLREILFAAAVKADGQIKSFDHNTAEAHPQEVAG